MDYLNLSAEAADRAFGAANLLLILGAVLVLVGTIGVVWAGGIRERYADERISKNETDTAHANERAAEANDRAAQADLARAKLEDRMKPRSLARPDLLQSAVSTFTNETLFIWCDTDQQPFAFQIWGAVRSAHWTRGGIGHSEGQRLPPGLTLYVSPDAPQHTTDAAQALADGLRAAGATDLDGPLRGSPSSQPAANSEIVLKIGARK